MSVTQVKKQTRPPEYDVAEDDRVYSTRSHSSARRYVPVKEDTHDDLPVQQAPFIQRRRASSGGLHPSNGMASRAVTPPTTGAWHQSKRFPLMAIILGMVAATVLVFALSSLGSWWRIHQDDMQYGRPRTYQFNAVVGHNDSPANPTHFILINLNRHVEIIEFPGGDATHARIYLGPTLFGDGQDLTPVTGEVRDVNGDGTPDLIVFIQDQHIIFINDGKEFRPLQPGDHVNFQS